MGTNSVVVKLDVEKRDALLTGSDFLRCIHAQSESVADLAYAALAGVPYEELVKKVAIVAENDYMVSTFRVQHEYAITNALVSTGGDTR